MRLARCQVLRAYQDTKIWALHRHRHFEAHLRTATIKSP
jgi:hypothetical protein